MLDESQENDYDLYEMSFCVQMQAAQNGVEVFYLEIFEYNNIQKIYDKYHLINEVKQIICSILKLKLPKSTKYAIFSKTKDKVSNIIEKMKEKKTQKSNKYNDHSTQFVSNKIPTSESSFEIEDESMVNKEQDMRKTLENEAEILRNLIGSNENQNNLTTELSEIQSKSKEIHSINLSPIKNENSKQQDTILGDSLHNQNTESQNLYKVQNNKNKVGIVIINPTLIDTDRTEVQEKRTNSLINNNLLSADFQYEDDLSSFASDVQKSFSNFDRINSNGTILSKVSGQYKQMTQSQKNNNKNHKDLIKRKVVQQKFFKSSPRNVTKTGGVLLQTTGYNYMNSFSPNLYGTVNQNKQIEEIKQQHSTFQKKQSFSSDRDSKMIKFHKKYEKEEEENSDDQEQNEEDRNIQMLQKKQKRALELNLDDSQDNLNMSVDISEMLNDNIQTQINDRASASSFRNEFNALKRKIINYIFDVSQHGLISSILIFGLISYLFFFGMTLFTFIIVKQSSSNQIDSIDQLRISSELIDTHFYITMIGQYLNFQDGKLSVDKISGSRIDQLKNIQKSSLSNYQEQILQIINLTEQSQILENVFKTKIMKNTYNVQMDKSQVINSLLYTMIENVEQLLNYMQVQDHNIADVNILSNKQLFYDQYNEVLDATKKNAQDSISYVQNLLKFGVILIEIVSILSISVVIPLYALIQRKREQILKLFSNFAKDKIEGLLFQIDDFLNSFVIKQQSDKNITQANKTRHIENIQWKKRTTSTTSSLKKCRTYIIVSGLIILVVVSVYPCVNYIYTTKFLEEYNQLVNEIVWLNQIKGLNLIKQSILYAEINKLFSDNIYLKELQYNYQKTIEDETDKISGLYNIKKNFDEQNIQNEEQLNQILVEPLNSNLCQMIDDKTLLIFEVDSKINEIDTCLNIWSGVLKGGLLVSNIELFSQQNYIYKMMQEYTQKDEFIKSFQSWEIPSKKLDDFDKLLYWINKIYKTIEYQTQEENKSSFEDISKIQMILLIIAIIMITLIYLVLWNIFIFHLYKEFIITKQSLSLLHSSLIMENNYFLSHLKNQKLS